MKQLDNIGNFFRKRLINDEVAEQEWNLPSDDIWTAAEPSFPKENSNKKWFVIFLLAGVCFFSMATIFMSNADSNDKIALDQTTSNFPLELNSVSDDKQVNSSNIVSDDKQVNSANSGDVQVLEHTNLDNASAIILKENVNQAEKTSSETRFDVALDKQRTNSFINPTSKDVFEDLTAFPNPESSSVGRSFQQVISPEFIIPSSKQHKNPQGLNSSELSTGYKSELINILNLPTKELVGLEFGNSLVISGLPKIVKLEGQQDRSRWEVGAAMSQFYQKPAWIIEDLLDEDDVFDLRTKQWGFNVSVTKLVSNRFSYSTGLILSNLDFDLQINDVQNFDDNTTIEILKKKIQDFVRVGNVSINSNERDINVEFISENDLRKGDILNLSVGIPINLNVYQLPFLVNYRSIKHKWEWNASGGISLDVVHIKVRDVDVDVQKDGISIINPVSVEPISDTAITGSLYLGAGIKYEIYPKLSLGLQSRLDLTELSLSKYDLGLYYKL